MRVLIERSTCPKRFVAFAAIADALRERGHSVGYWNYSLNHSQDAIMMPCDRLVAWGEVTPQHRSFASQAWSAKRCVIFIGDGLFREKGVYQFGYGGVDSLAYWTLYRSRVAKLIRQVRLNPEKSVALIVQDESPAIEMFSPWFRSFADAKRHIAEHWRGKIDFVREGGDIDWSQYSVALTLNSMAAMGAIEAGVVVGSMAHSAFRHPHAAVAIDDCPHSLRTLLASQVRGDQVWVDSNACRKFVARARQNEFTIELTLPRVVSEIERQAPRFAAYPPRATQGVVGVDLQ